MYRLLSLLALFLFSAGCADYSSDYGGDRESLFEGPVTAQEPAAWVKDAVVYEVFVTQFTPEGTFQAMIPRLDELKALGVNTLWLMPIHPVGQERKKGDLGSPYAIQDYFDVNPAFGTRDDFRALVDSVHARDMKLIIDLVANHTAWDNAWITEHPEWYTRGDDGEMIHPKDTDWTDVADLDYSQAALREEMTRAMRYWVEEFDIDGYRCDVADLVPGEFWVDAIAELRTIKPDIMMLAESAAPEVHTYGFDLSYAWPFYSELKEVWRGASADRLTGVLGMEENDFLDWSRRLRFTTNHDETAWDDTPINLFGGTQGARAAATLVTLLPGNPLVYNGQEVGDPDKIPLFEKRTVNWEADSTMRAFYEELLALYASEQAFSQGEFAPLDEAGSDAYAFTRNLGGRDLLVTVNVRDTETSFDLPTPLANYSFNAIFGAGELADGSVTLAPYGFAVWEWTER
ncbi:MAG: alpha-amylase family glycosyl hydrolase [Bacteroidota bacterium]